MKSKKSILTIALSLVSTGILIIFWFMGTGCVEDLLWEASTEATHEIQDDGKRKTTYTTGLEDQPKTVKSTTGERDTQGRWVGQVVQEKGRLIPRFGEPDNYIVESTERVNMEDGARDGVGTTTFRDGRQETVCWDMGTRIPCAKGSGSVYTDQSAFEILFYEYPWYVHWLHVFEFDNTYIEGYLDTLELLIFSNEPAMGEFEDAYSDAIDLLAEGTVYDTMTVVHNILTLLVGLDEIKNSQFRLAVIDQSRQDQNTTYEMIATKYPGYLEMMNDAEIGNEEFEDFCNAFDSVMNTYTVLDPEDPFYVDSLENRIYNTLNIMSLEDVNADNSGGLKSVLLQLEDPEAMEPVSRGRIKTVQDILVSRSDIAGMVFSSMLSYLLNGDKILEAVDQAYRTKQSIVSLPKVTTGFVDHLSPTSVELEGSILDDGGGAIGESGIAWADHYDPVLDDHSVASGPTTGTFKVTVDGLTEGQTYFARTYATNAAGTAYGNNVEFITQNTQGTQTHNRAEEGIRIYPNPATSTASIELYLDNPEEVTVLIYDLKGTLVARPYMEGLPPGVNKVDLNLSALPGSLYQCEVHIGNRLKQTRKLMIIR